MADEKYVTVKGDIGKLYRREADAWRPIICITDNSRNLTTETSERVNMCTGGETQVSVRSVRETLSVNGLIIDTTSVGVPPRETSEDIFNLAYSQMEDGDSEWKLDRGPSGNLFFKATVTSASDNFASSEDATYSFELAIQGRPTTVDPYPEG